MARPSVDEEQTPLLRDFGDDRPEQNTTNESNFGDRIHAIAQEPLTPLTKILLVLGLVLLLTSSIFIGLFAGAQHKLGLDHGGGEHKTVTVTLTSTSVSTSTSISTTTEPVPPEPTKEPSEKRCLEPHCIILSASILSSIDTSQDPCENFYDFANGGWLKSHPLPPDKPSFGKFEALAQENKQIIRTILESSTSVSPLDDQILTKLRDFYSSCMDEDKLDEIGTAPLRHLVDTLRKLYRGNDTDITAADAGAINVKGLTAALAFIHSRGIEGLFSFDIEGDVGVDPNHMVLWFNQPGLGLPSKEYYEEQAILEVYNIVLERLLITLTEEEEESADSHSQSSVLTTNEEHNVWPPWPWPPWGGDDDSDKKPVNRTLEAQKLAKKVVKFESKIAQASLDLDIIQQDPVATYNPVPLANLTDTITQIHFPTYFSAFTPRSYPDTVILTYPDFAASLSNILNETSADVVEAYLITRVALSLSPYLGRSTEAWQAHRTLLEALTGIKKGAVGDRSEQCIGQVENSLGFASGRFFVNETFGGDSRDKGTKVITDIVESFKTSLKDIDWMDAQSAKAAAEKADAIRVKVGFPISPDTRNPRSIISYYRDVKANKLDFFGNVLSAGASSTFKTWSQLGKSRDLNTWEMYPSTVNAYFNPPSNEIVFPAGILRPPFFSVEWPNYLSYGAFGQVAAHELTHAFDSAGRLYNQEGKLKQWWTNATSEGFKVKQDCIVEQYSGYAIDDGKGGKVHVNGNLTSGENIGDTGLIQAYRAWKAQFHTSEKAGTEYLLPGLNYTREQLFFISFARIWARASSTAAAVQRIRTDPHSPTRFRVDGTVSNIPAFAQIFKCSRKAKLNPPNEDRCIFWS
ncbi:Endothelin-converting enzyme-like protein [Psilocybe cubensis]|uniref:Endothelin-converting enzyme-like protein n=2 Tax=Psilocybe cubensis TaxID=181762 RepID=A0ACB8H8A1_PSICU|nr:Endothelin-converting enzyme-like protein [Psilocybe cubensis]KAH9484148.1 Endothelin-converting enzyme-like protein [Psilocybe cubensis]